MPLPVGLGIGLLWYRDAVATPTEILFILGPYRCPGRRSVIGSAGGFVICRVEPVAAAPTDVWLWPISNGQAPVCIGSTGGSLID